MNTVSIAGSPRKDGNSDRILSYLLGEIKRFSNTDEFNLRDMSFKGCIGCMACKEMFDECVLNDDLKSVLNLMKKSEVLILSSPVYFRDVSSLMKMFIDRTFSFVKPDFMINKDPSRLLKGKKLIFIQTQALHEPVDVFENYDHYYFKEKWGFEKTYAIKKKGVYFKDDFNMDDSFKSEINEIIKDVYTF